MAAVVRARRRPDLGRRLGGLIGVVVWIQTVGRVAYRDQPSQAASVRLDEGEEAGRIYAPIRGWGGQPDRRGAPETAAWAFG